MTSLNAGACPSLWPACWHDHLRLPMPQGTAKLQKLRRKRDVICETGDQCSVTAKISGWRPTSTKRQRVRYRKLTPDTHSLALRARMALDPVNRSVYSKIKLWQSTRARRMGGRETNAPYCCTQ
jgi:hypothetical protein